MIEENKQQVKYYENDYPKQDELVQVKCIKCEENGSYVELLEYQGKPGMIPISEYSTSMKKTIQRAMKVGKEETVRVIRVDANKGYIDLSKNKVDVEDENRGRDKLSKAKAIHSILIHVSQECKVDIQSLYQTIIWPLYKKQVHPLDMLKLVLIKEEKIDELGIENPAVKQSLLNEIRRRFEQPILKSMAIFKVSLKSFDGIVQLKRILKAGVQASSDKGYNIKITILGAPDYLCEVSTSTQKEGEAAINYALAEIEKQTKQQNGQFQVKTKPKVVGDSSAKLHEMYAQMMQNQNGGEAMEEMDNEDDENDE